LNDIHTPSHYLFTNPLLLSKLAPSIVSFLQSCTKSKIPSILKKLLENFHEFMAILSDSIPCQSCTKNHTSNSSGTIRFNILHIIATLASIHSVEINSIFLSFDLFNHVISLMEVYPQSSILHNYFLQLFESSLYDTQNCQLILESCPLLNFMAFHFERYNRGKKLEVQIKKKSTLVGRCMNIIQSNPSLLYSPKWNEKLKDQTFGCLKYGYKCQFMIQVRKISQIILQFTQLETMQSRELLRFVEKHDSWKIIKKTLTHSK